MSAAFCTPPSNDTQVLADQFAAIALEAGEVIMRAYHVGCAAWEKADRSPVTEADEAAEKVVLEGLAAAVPDIPVVAEEAMARGRLPEIGREFILVDALDGTREFLKRNGEFTVNIALVRDGTPCCGVVFAPALGRIWIGGRQAFGADVDPHGKLPPPDQRPLLKARPRPARDMVALASRSHCNPQTEAFLSRLPVAARKEGGSSVKFCLLAEGAADVYPRFGPTMEWDTAAGDAILRAAGGCVRDCAGLPLTYGKSAQKFRNQSFIAWGRPGLDANS